VKVGDGVATIGGRLFRAGETITIDGSTGEVFAGEVQGSTAIVPEAGTLLAWPESSTFPSAKREDRPRRCRPRPDLDRG